MAKLRTSWREKMVTQGAKNNLPRVVEVNEKMSQKWGTGTCVIPAPTEVDEIMSQVPKGRLTTINQIREVLAKKHHASFG
jgi:hypothetical protein